MHVPNMLPAELQSLKLDGESALFEPSSVTSCISQLHCLQSLAITHLDFTDKPEIGGFADAVCNLALSLRDLVISVPLAPLLAEDDGYFWETTLSRIFSACVSLTSLKVHGTICSARVIRSIEAKALRCLELTPKGRDNEHLDHTDTQHDEFCSAVLQLSALPLEKVVIYHNLSGVTIHDEEVQKQLRDALRTDNAFFCSIVPEENSDDEDNSDGER